MDTEVDSDAEQAWRDEIERRIAAIDSGSVQLVPWEGIQDRLIRRFQP